PGDAAELPFGDDSFDAAISQAALMFFGDRVSALREMGLVAGRVVVQVPGRLAASPGYLALAVVIARRSGPAAQDLLGFYFNVGEPALLVDLFGIAGHVPRRGAAPGSGDDRRRRTCCHPRRLPPRAGTVRRPVRRGRRADRGSVDHRRLVTAVKGVE
ncbi:MAG TPA: methyltransferase domain-containing protein, partial [Asanoa sp.]|nr:methyltransferase domain-containing protein [Asanoa sp.]